MVYDVEAPAWSPGALGLNLVGMSLLRRLSKFEVRSERDRFAALNDPRRTGSNVADRCRDARTLNDFQLASLLFEGEPPK